MFSELWNVSVIFIILNLILLDFQLKYEIHVQSVIYYWKMVLNDSLKKSNYK